MDSPSEWGLSRSQSGIDAWPLPGQERHVSRLTSTKIEQLWMNTLHQHVFDEGSRRAWRDSTPTEQCFLVATSCDFL